MAYSTSYVFDAHCHLQPVNAKPIYKCVEREPKKTLYDKLRINIANKLKWTGRL